jgi:hypothetical protein
MKSGRGPNYRETLIALLVVVMEGEITYWMSVERGFPWILVFVQLGV